MADPRDIHEGELDLQAMAYLAAEKAREQVQTHPVRSLAAAFGVGYVLGGGLPNWALRVGAAVAMRTLSQEALRQASSSGFFGGDVHEPEPHHDVDVTPAE